VKKLPSIRLQFLGWAGVLLVGLILPACGSTHSTLRVNTPPTAPLGQYKSVQIQCTSEDEKAQEFTGRLESQIMVKLKERDTFQEYFLSKDACKPELVVKVTILDLKKASAVAVGWYTRNTSKVNCDIVVQDTKTNDPVTSFSVVAKPRYSAIEQAIDDAATQIADFMREHK
jgi:hypothetical protein